MALLLAASAVVVGRVAPGGALATAVVLLPAGAAVAGAAGTVPLFLAGPVIGGAVAQAFGYPALGLVPLAVAAVLLAAFSRASRPAR
jgi:hypothetical protein